MDRNEVQSLINRAMIHKPVVMFSKQLSTGSFLCCDVFSSSTIAALGSEFGHIFVLNTDLCNHRFLSTTIDICSSAIFDVCWINDSTIGVGSDDSKLYIHDLAKKQVLVRSGHTKSVRCVKKVSKRMYTGGCDGNIFVWDVNVNNPVLKLPSPSEKHRIITSIAVNRNEKYLIYATSAPETNLSIWDLRYIKKGLYTSEQIKTSNYMTTSIYHMNSFLYLLFSDSSLLRLTETGIFMNYIRNNATSIVSEGAIDYCDYNDLIIAGSMDKIILYDTNFPNTASSYDVEQINGLRCIDKKHILTYDNSGNISVCKLHFNYGKMPRI